MKGTADQIPSYATGVVPISEERGAAPPRAGWHQALKKFVHGGSLKEIDCVGSLNLLVEDDASATGWACAACHAPFQPDGTPATKKLGIIR